MEFFSRSFFELSYGNPFFIAAAAACGVLAVLAIVFVVIAISLRVVGNRKQARLERLYDEWAPLLLEAMAGNQSPAEVQKRIRPEDSRDFLTYIYRFARRVQGTDLAVLQDIAQPYLRTLAGGRDERTPERRARRIQILGLLGFRQYVDQVTKALDDPSPLVAMVAARALARRQHPEYVRLVLEKLDRFQAWSSDTLSSLVSNLGLAVAPDLRRTYADEERPPWVRAVAADALRKLNDVDSADVAAHILRDLGEADARPLLTASLRLLEHVGHAEHRAVIYAFTDHDDYVVRIHAVGALSQIGGPEATNRLLEAVSDPSRWVAMQAVEGLKRAGRKDDVREVAASDHHRAQLAQQALFEREI